MDLLIPPLYAPHQQLPSSRFRECIPTDGVRATRRPTDGLSTYKPVQKNASRASRGWPYDPLTVGVHAADPQAIYRTLCNLRQIVTQLLDLLVSAFLARLCWVRKDRSSQGQVGLLSGNRNPRALTDSGKTLSNTPPRDLTGEVVPDPSKRWPMAGGGFANIYLAIWSQNGRQTKVAVKVLKLPRDDGENVAKISRERLYKEISIWARLKHRNILPLYGVTSGFGPPGTNGIVCRWIENGDLTRYLTKYKLSSVERLQILRQITDCISYLHSNNVVHGDLTGNNILIGDDGHVFICDFGLSTICDPAATACQTTSTAKFNIRWTAPEIILSGLRPTKFTDVYSLASVMLQVFTGCAPYYGKTDGWIITHLHSGNHHPLRPPERGLVSTELWGLMLRCWATLPGERPNVTEISNSLSS